MENKHASDGLAEDVIRSFVQIASAEMHAKTILEKRVSELENGLIDLEQDLEEQLEKIKEAKAEIMLFAELRRADMLYLFELYGGQGDKERWCVVKHLAIAMMTAFEAWQASDGEEALLSVALAKNKCFLKALTQFLGIELTECAACFADIIKGGLENDKTENM